MKKHCCDKEPMLGKFIAGDFIAIAGKMHRFPASNENTGNMWSKNC
jgi:hypothetical protein